MENFILYEEIGKGSNSIVYKGRRKGTINFLAILCVEKDARAATTNWVRVTHELSHDNIVKFQEWYETSNHLWMVVELCTGGTLREILTLDSCLPEETVRCFGKDILQGMHYLHERGIVFGDLRPKKVLLDGPGKLKLTNFSLSRMQDENLLEVYQQASASDDDTSNKHNLQLKGKKEYQAPEIIKGGSPSLAGDIWALGVVLYELYTGSVPYQNASGNDLIKQMSNLSFADPQEQRPAMIPKFLKDEKASSLFLDILRQTLNPNPDKRPSTFELLKHPFWKTGFDGSKGDAPEPTKSQQTPDKKDGRSSSCATTAPESVNVLDSTFTLSSRPHTAQSFDRPSTKSVKVSSSQSKASLGVTYSVAKRLASSTRGSISDSLTVKSLKEAPADHPESIKDIAYHDTDMELSVIQDNPQIRKVDPIRWDAKSLPFQALPSLDHITPDDLYNHLKQVLQCFQQPTNASHLRTKSTASLYLSQMCTCDASVANFVLNSQMLPLLAALVKTSVQQSPDAAAKAARAIGLAASCATELEHCTKITDVLSMLNDALRENFRSTKAKLCILPALGQLLFLISEQEEGGANEHGNAPNPQAHQQQQTGLKGNWGVPSATYNLITRCLREGEDPIVQHYASKTVECVTALASIHGRKFLNASSQGSAGTTSSHGSDVIGTMLWTVSERATNEALKQSALSAICRLNRLTGSGGVLQGILDRVGLAPFLSALARASYKCQQALVTAFVETLLSAPKGQAARIANGKDILPSLMKLFDNTSAVVRAKVILAVTLLLKRNPSLLMTACQNRLIMYVERDWRRVRTPSAGAGRRSQNQPSNTEYVCACLNHLINHVVHQAPHISASCIAILDETMKRKHPSTQQIKQLKTSLPTYIILHHMVTSQVFRSHVVTSEFVTQLGQLLCHVTRFMKKGGGAGGQHLSGTATAVGEDTIQKFIDTVLSIVECLSQHSLVLTQHEEATMNSLVPQLIALLNFYSAGNGQVVCIKLLTDILGTLLNYSAVSTSGSGNVFPPTGVSLTPSTPSSRSSSRSSLRSARSRRPDLPDKFGVRDAIVNLLLCEFQPVLLASDPLPAYGVRFLATILEYWPSVSSSIHDCGLIPVLLTLFKEHHAPVLSSCAQNLVSLLTLLVRYADDQVAGQMYENDLVEHVVSYLNDMSTPYMASGTDDKPAIADGIFQLLMLLKCLLDRVTAAVKRALKTQSANESSNNNSHLRHQTAPQSTEGAEKLLVLHKPLTEIQGLCMFLLSDEQELSEVALACLSLMIQLYGGDHPATMSTDNMNRLTLALSNLQPKSQRILLKLIKRIASLNEHHASRLVQHQELQLAIREVGTSAAGRDDLATQSVATDIASLVQEVRSRIT